MVAAGMEVFVEAGAGLASGFADADYGTAGAKVQASPGALLESGDVLLKVQRPSAQELDGIPERVAVVAYSLQSRGDAELTERLKRRRISALSLDLLPRIARAQGMDVLSSMANIAGYKSVLIAANALGKFFPMLMTAAGTVLPAKVFVIGAGVAGLQAVATARRLGAVLSAFDIRPLNIPSAMAFQASQLYSRNVLNFLMHLYDRQARKISLDPADEIVKGCLIAHAGEMLQPA